MSEQLLTIEEAAARLGLSVWTLREWIQFSRIESHKLGGKRQVSESEIKRLIEESKIPRNPRARVRIRKNQEARESSETLASAA